MDMYYQGRKLNKMKGLLIIKKLIIAIGGDPQLIKAMDEAMDRCLAEKQEELRQLLAQHNGEAIGW